MDYVPALVIKKKSILPDFEAASKYLSNGWLASSGFLGGADFSLSFEVPLSLLSALLRAAFAKADMLLEIDAELISEPEPNSFSSFLDSAFSLPVEKKIIAYLMN